MPPDPDAQRRLLDDARNGDQEALGELLDGFRPQLTRLTEPELDPGLRVRIDASDIVQQTCLSAIRRFADFNGTEIDQFAAWLQRVHHNNILDAVRNNKRVEKRDISREQTLSDSGLANDAGTDNREATPSQNALRREATAMLENFLKELPADQRDVVQLRFLEGWAFKDIAAHLERSEDSVAGLLKRGLRNLRKNYDATEQQDNG